MTNILYHPWRSRSFSRCVLYATSSLHCNSHQLARFSGFGSVSSACSQVSHANLHLLNTQSRNDYHSRQLRKMTQAPGKSPKSNQRLLSAPSQSREGSAARLPGPPGKAGRGRAVAPRLGGSSLPLVTENWVYMGQGDE